MNEYRVLYRSDKFNHSAKVFIYALNDFQAMDIVMNTYDIPKQWITHVSLWKQNVNVVSNGKNTYAWSNQ